MKRQPSALRPIIARVDELSHDKNRPIVVALDGYSGAGKSLLAEAIAVEVDAAVVTVDDFCSGGTLAEWDARTAGENAERCVDWQRLRSQAVEPLLVGRVAEWHPFNWETRQGVAKHVIRREPRQALILEGAYSARPELSDLIDLSVLVDAPVDVRGARLIEREGALGRWFPRWDAAERHYFKIVRPPSSFDLVVVNVD